MWSLIVGISWSRDIGDKPRLIFRSFELSTSKGYCWSVSAKYIQGIRWPKRTGSAVEVLFPYETGKNFLLLLLWIESFAKSSTLSLISSLPSLLLNAANTSAAIHLPAVAKTTCSSAAS